MILGECAKVFRLPAKVSILIPAITDIYSLDTGVNNLQMEKSHRDGPKMTNFDLHVWIAAGFSKAPHHGREKLWLDCQENDITLFDDIRIVMRRGCIEMSPDLKVSIGGRRN